MTSCEEWGMQATLSEQAKCVFTANRSDEEPWRLSRLKEVYEVAQQISMLVWKRPFPKDAVSRMHDHKGELTVQFADDEWEEELASFFDLAWRSVFECDLRTCSVGDGDLAFIEIGGSA